MTSVFKCTVYNSERERERVREREREREREKADLFVILGSLAILDREVTACD